MKKWQLAVVVGALLVFASKAYAAIDGAPEIDAGSATTALGVLSGAIALAAERLRRK